jgi:hypothetical protein
MYMGDLLLPFAHTRLILIYCQLSSSRSQPLPYIMNPFTGNKRLAPSMVSLLLIGAGLEEVEELVGSLAGGFFRGRSRRWAGRQILCRL